MVFESTDVAFPNPNECIIYDHMENVVHVDKLKYDDKVKLLDWLISQGVRPSTQRGTNGRLTCS